MYQGDEEVGSVPTNDEGQYQLLLLAGEYTLKPRRFQGGAYIENGGDPFSLQRILGHSNQTTTSKYVNMARTNVKSQHSKYSPGERLD